MIDKWQLYSQAGVDGPEYGVRIRPGYVVVGFQLEDARQIVAWQNASIQPEGDILERAMALLADLNNPYEIQEDGPGHWISEGRYKNKIVELMPELIADIERLRSSNEVWKCHAAIACDVENELGMEKENSKAKDARIKELEAERALFCSPGSTLEAALIQLREARERIKELEFMQSRHTWQCASCEYNPSDGSVIGKDPYVKRLEAAFLDNYLYIIEHRQCHYPGFGVTKEMREEAREALEELRHGTV